MEEKILFGPTCHVDFEDEGLGMRYFNKLDTFKDKLVQVDASKGSTETASSVKRRAIQVATELLRVEVKPDDIVAMCCNSRMDQAVVVLGTLFVGAQLAVLDPDMNNQEFHRKIIKLNPKVIFCDVRVMSFMERFGDQCQMYVFGHDAKKNSITHIFNNKPNEGFRPVRISNSEQKTAFIILTEGTTGSPKIVKVSHFASYIRTVVLLDTMLKDVKKVVSYFPLMGTAQIILICCSFEVNIVRIVPKGFSEREVCRIIHDLKVEIAILGTVHTRMLADYIVKGQDYNISCLKRILIGGAATPPSTLMYLNKVFSAVDILNVYSSTECGIIAGITPENIYLEKVKPASCGTVFPAGKVKIVDIETKKCLGQDSWGELWYTGPDVALGYFDEPTKDFMEKGFFRTGDIAQFDEQGCLFIYGRLDDKFDIDAHTFFAIDLESIFSTNEHVKECSVSRYAGQLVIYAIAADVTTKQLYMWLEQKVPSYMVPSMIYLVNDIPKTNNGKVKKYLMAKIVSRRSILDSVSD